MSCCSLRRVLLLLGCCVSSPVVAQSPDWARVDQSASWYGVFVEQPVGQRAALWFDGQWRRTGLGAMPQQLLLRPGLLMTVAPGVQLGGGYAWIATAPYGESPATTPSREHRVWQQLLLSHDAGALDLRHRFRWEQRWIAPVTEQGTDAWDWQQRARYMVRAQANLPGVRVLGRRVLAFGWEELLLPVGGGGAALSLTQNRIGAGLGVSVGPRERLELGYMNQWNALAARSTNEFNHTFTVSLIVTP